MYQKFNYILALSIGAAIGSVVTAKLLKHKYEQMAQEEIESFIEMSEKRMAAVSEENSEPEKDVGEEEEVSFNKTGLKPNIMEYASRLKDEGYTNYSNTEVESPAKPVPIDMPYVISPEEFGEFEDYERISLTLYSDGVLATDNDDIVDDVDEIVGADSLSHFGEYEDDSVFVRNDRLKCDYEILYDPNEYENVIQRKPHQMEV